MTDPEEKLPLSVDPTERRSLSKTPKARRNRAIFLWVSAAAAALVIIGSAEVLLPFILALLVAFILLPGVLYVQRKGVARWGAILIVYAITLGTIGGFVRLTLPALAGEVQSLRHDLPQRIRFIQDNWLPIVDRKLETWGAQNAPEPPKVDAVEPKPIDEEDIAAPAPSGPPPTMVIEKRPDGSYNVVVGDRVQIRKIGEDVYRLEHPEREESVSSARIIQKAFSRATKYLSENTGEVIRIGQQIVGAVWRGIFTLVMTLMLAAYMMLTHESIIRFFRDLVSFEAQPAFDRLLHRLEKGLAGVVRGQLVICGVNGVLSAIGFWLFDLKYWPIMALLAAVGSVIPIFGSILATIPAVVLGLTQSPGTALAVLAWSVGIHQLEANLLNPKIIGDAAHIHPVLVVFSLIVGEHFFQIKGALLAVPCMSMLQTVFLHFRETTMGLADPNATAAPAAIREPASPLPPRPAIAKTRPPDQPAMAVGAPLDAAVTTPLSALPTATIPLPPTRPIVSPTAPTPDPAAPQPAPADVSPVPVTRQSARPPATESPVEEAAEKKPKT